MNASRQSPDPASRRQLLALIIVTLGVMILGILVVAAPDRFGVPRPAPTAIATPIAPG